MWKLAAVLDDPHAARECPDLRTRTVSDANQRRDFFMRSILLWALGVPIPIIILIALLYR